MNTQTQEYQNDLIKKLAIVGCRYLTLEGMTAKNIASYSQACIYAFDITPEQSRDMMGKMVHYYMKKEDA